MGQLPSYGASTLPTVTILSIANLPLIRQAPLIIPTHYAMLEIKGIASPQIQLSSPSTAHGTETVKLKVIWVSQANENIYEIEYWKEGNLYHCSMCEGVGGWCNVIGMISVHVGTNHRALFSMFFYFTCRRCQHGR